MADFIQRLAHRLAGEANSALERLHVYGDFDRRRERESGKD